MKFSAFFEDRKFRTAADKENCCVSIHPKDSLARKQKPLGPLREVVQSRLPDGLQKGEIWQ